MAFYSSTASFGAVAPAGTLSVNITSPHNGQYLDSSTVTVQWEGNDTSSGIWFYEVFLESLADGWSVGLQTNYTFHDLADGSHTVIVRAINDQGQKVDDSVVFYVDTSAPYLDIISPLNEAALNVSDINLVWQASDPTMITYYEVKMDGADWILFSPEVTNHTFEGAADGEHTLTVIAHDGAGNYTSRSITVLVDTTYPTVDILYPTDGTGFSHSDVTLSWIGDDEGDDIQYYEVWSNGVMLATTTSTMPLFHFTYLKDGIYNVAVKVFDQANSTAVDNVTFTVDTIEPSVVSFAPQGDQVAVDSPIVVTFSKEMDRGQTTISISGVTGAVTWDDLNATFTPSTHLAYGTAYTVTVNGRDMVGNEANRTWTFTTTDMGTLSGVVLDNNGNPMSGVTVIIDNGASVVTNETGAYYFNTHAGQHNLTMSKSGWDGQTATVLLVAGQVVSGPEIRMSPTSFLGGMGWLVAVIAVVIVALLIYFSYRRKKEKGPPAHRSWKGMEDLQKRAGKSKKKRYDEDDEDDLI